MPNATPRLASTPRLLWALATAKLALATLALAALSGAHVPLHAQSTGAGTVPAPSMQQSPRPDTLPNAQADTLFEVRLRDGSSLVGRIERRGADGLVLVTTAGIRMEVPAISIRDVRIARGRMENGEYWLPDPNRTRLFFAPTARSIGNGNGYAGTFLVLLPFLAYGIGDHITIAGGAPVLFGQLDPIYIAPKVTLLETPVAAVAVGVLSVFGTGKTSDNVGVAFGMGTFGTPDRAFTGGIGFGYSGDDFAGKPAFMLGGETRVSRNLKLITENYFVAGVTGGLLSGGLRLLTERLSVDVGLMVAAGGGELGCCLPVVNFAYAFGH